MSNIRERIAMNKKPIIIGVSITTVLVLTISLIVYLTWPEIEDPLVIVINAADRFKQNVELSKMRGSYKDALAKLDPKIDDYKTKINIVDTANGSLSVNSTKTCRFIPDEKILENYTITELALKSITSHAKVESKIPEAENIIEPTFHQTLDTKVVPSYKDMIKIPLDLHSNWNDIVHPMKISYYVNAKDEVVLKVYDTYAQNYTFGKTTLNNLEINNSFGDEKMKILLLLKPPYLHLKLYFTSETGCSTIEYKIAVEENYNFERAPIGNFVLVQDNETLENKPDIYGLTLNIDTMFSPVFVEMIDGETKLFKSHWPFTFTNLHNNRSTLHVNINEFTEYIRLINVEEDKYIIFAIYGGKDVMRKFSGYRIEKNDPISGERGYFIEDSALNNIISSEEKNAPFGTFSSIAVTTKTPETANGDASPEAPTEVAPEGSPEVTPEEPAEVAPAEETPAEETPTEETNEEE